MSRRGSRRRYGGTRRGTASRGRTRAAWSSRSPSRRCSAMPADLVTVVGVGADGWNGLSPAARAAVESAEVLMGSPRQLALVPPDLGVADDSGDLGAASPTDVPGDVG